MKPLNNSLESKAELMPMNYIMGIKLSVFFTLGLFFTYLSQYKTAQGCMKNFLKEITT